MEILYKELSYRIIGCVFDVFREIGPGYDEFTYHHGLQVRFIKDGLSFLSKPHFKLHYRGVEIAELEPDYLVEEKIVLELKSIQTDFELENYTQIISYLRLTNKRLGILINFGLLEANFKRVPFDERELKIEEDLEEMLPLMKDHEDEIHRLRDGIVNVANELRLGHHAKIYQKATRVELEFNQFSWDEHVKVPVTYQKGLNLNIGLIAFWGKDHLYIRGVDPLH